MLAHNSILYVDDNEFALVVAAAYLARYGFHVVGASSAKEALRILKRQPVQIVVTDFDMPDTNGLELARIIRHTRPALPIFVRSGQDRPSESINGDINGWFLKGEPLSVLLQKLQDCMSRISFESRRESEMFHLPARRHHA